MHNLTNGEFLIKNNRFATRKFQKRNDNRIKLSVNREKQRKSSKNIKKYEKCLSIVRFMAQFV